MKILVTGASGLVGSGLVPALRRGGHDVVRLVRRPPASADEIRWDPAAAELDPAAVAGFDAVVHLAGENIASGRWTSSRLDRIRQSRTGGTRLLAERLAASSRPPAVAVCASAVGAYGDRGDELLTEDSGFGTGFLADVCREWEQATAPLAESGARVVNLRIGIVLAKDGGAFAKMLLPFRLGIAGVVGSGRQYISWLTLDDLIAIIERVLHDDEFRGPVNAVSPQPVTNREFTKTLGAVLHRPTILPLPAFAARLVLGRMADELLLASARVLPARLEAAGHPFRHPELAGAFRAVLGNDA